MTTLLIVEDDKKTNEAICEYLKPTGHTVIPAYDGREALQFFRQNSIDLVVLDIMLPHISGLSVLHEIRKTSTVPVLMLTAIGDEHIQITSFDEQADDYMTKPFSMVLLGKRITALLRRSGQALTPQKMMFGDVTVDFSGYTASGSNGKIDIMPKEIDLLRLLVEHKGLVLTRTQIQMAKLENLKTSFLKESDEYNILIHQFLIPQDAIANTSLHRFPQKESCDNTAFLRCPD